MQRHVEKGVRLGCNGDNMPGEAISLLSLTQLSTIGPGFHAACSCLSTCGGPQGNFFSGRDRGPFLLGPYIRPSSKTIFVWARERGAENMAESLVSSVVSKLTNLLAQEAAFLRGVRDQVDWVKTELKRMEGFLKDAESRRRRGDERVENWIREIRDAAYEVEDIIDRVKFTAERQRQRGGGFMGSLSRYSHKPCELFTIHKIGSKIGKIKDKIRSISESRASYGIPNLGEGGIEKSGDLDDNLQALRKFPPHFDDDTGVVGFDYEKEKLAKLLVDPENKNRSVISIVGMGGLGKTTLARSVYTAIKEQFETSAWISVSQNYRVIELLKEIMKKAMGLQKKKETTSTGITVEEDLERMPEEEVREKLRDFLRGRKYLVAMDDVWAVNVWRQMQQVFPNENNGSRILLTTRYIEVARDAEPWIPPHELQLLNDTQSLELFGKKAFPPNQDVPAEMEELAQKLAKRCGGLPLALVLLGGLLSRKGRTYSSWMEVAESMMNWTYTEDGQQCLDILGLSYQELPYLLKPCFLYIAAFPEDSIISASKLVRLWIAEGFIPQEQRMEDTARVWLDELVQRCMIQVANRTSVRRRVKSIRIHDKLRDFGLSEARMDGFLRFCSSEDGATSDGKSSHRAAFHNRMNDEVGDSSPHLRTLLGFDLVLTDSTAAGFGFLKGLNLLRVLDLEGTRDLKKLPKQICRMIHLRYLGLRRTGLTELPSSIGHLLNLQTLDVRDTKILWLPKSFWEIRTLRHLYINKSMFLSTPIIGDQKNLQTLRIEASYRSINRKSFFSHLLGIRFIKTWVTAPRSPEEAIKKERERMLGEPIGKALEKMDSLVSLSLEVYAIPRDVLFAGAPSLHQLRSLNLDGRLLLKQQQQLADSSQFPPNITKLTLTGSYLEQDPLPVLEKLENLRLLQLRGDVYVGKSMSCSAGGFPRLQHLILTSLFHLEEWRVEVGAMSSLTHLSIYECRKLKMLPEGLQHLTTLRELELISMSHEFNDRVRNEDGYKVRHIPSIIFEHEKQ